MANKSPSVKKRDECRMTKFNSKKKEDALTKEIIACKTKIKDLEQKLGNKENVIFKLEVQISKWKFNSFKSRPKLSIRNVANQDIPPAPPSTKSRLMKLSIMNVARQNIPPAPPLNNSNYPKPVR